MPASTPTVNGNISPGDGSVILVTWTLTTADPDGGFFEWPQWADRCTQAVGTWGGATLTMQGSNNGTDAFSMSNAAGGTAATFTVDGGKTLIEAPRFVRPKLTTVGVGATVVVTLLARRQK